MIASQNQEILVVIRKKLDKHFGEEDLNTICFDLGIDYESLSGYGKAAKTREMVIHCERMGITEKLLAEVKSLRTNVDWPTLPKTS